MVERKITVNAKQRGRQKIPLLKDKTRAYRTREQLYYFFKSSRDADKMPNRKDIELALSEVDCWSIKR